MLRRMLVALSVALVLSVPALLAQRRVLTPTVITLHVPADAKVEIGGHLTKSVGETRRYLTPPLELGRQYSYDVVVTYADGTVRREVIHFVAGKEAIFDFRVAKAQPEKEEGKKPAEKKPEEKKPPEKKTEPKPVGKPPEPKQPPKRKPDVIFVPTPQSVVEKMLELAGVNKNDVVYDLGCGDGRIVVTAAKKYGARGKGIDIDPERVKESQENVRKNGVEKLVTIEQADLFEVDLSQATVITLYLLPELNLKLRPKLQKLKPGTRIVSHDFDMGDWKWDKHVTVTDENGLEHDVYLWVIKGSGQRAPQEGELDRRLAATSLVTLQEEKPKLKPDVVYVPTPQKVVEKMLEVAGVTKEDVVYDLGCGDGRIVVTAAKKYGCRSVGYDIDPERIKESLDNVRKNKVEHLVKIEQRDIFTVDVSPATVVALYLLPNLNAKLVPQLQKMKPGSRVVTHDFPIPGYKRVKEVKVDPGEGFSREHIVYLYIIPLEKE